MGLTRLLIVSAQAQPYGNRERLRMWREVAVLSGIPLLLDPSNQLRRVPVLWLLVAIQVFPLFNIGQLTYKLKCSSEAMEKGYETQSKRRIEHILFLDPPSAAIPPEVKQKLRETLENSWVRSFLGVFQYVQLIRDHHERV